MPEMTVAEALRVAQLLPCLDCAEFGVALDVLADEVRRLQAELADLQKPLSFSAVLLAEPMGGPCETCRHAWFDELDGVPFCKNLGGLWACSTLGGGCWAWEAK